MADLEQLGREVQVELGEPSSAWLRAQRNELRRAFSSPGPARRFGPRRVALGLVFAAAIAGVVFFVSSRSAPDPRTATEQVLNAPTGERRIALTDGSSLTLAPLSLARVNSAPAATRCVVELGTVKFDVAPQKGRPFTVVAGAFEIRVVGTRFSVSRDAAGAVEVRVDHGVVRVQAPSRSAPIELEAGDRLRGDDAGLSLTHAVAAPAVSAALLAPELPSLSPEPRASSSSAPKVNSARSDWHALYRERDYAGALAAARQVGIERLLDSLGAQQLADLADAARLASDSELSLRAFSSVERRFPASPQARDALFLSGRIYASRGQSEAALARFEKYLSQNPSGAYSIEATGRLVELYSARGDARAKATAQSYLERAPHGPYQRLCRSLLASP
ncbi:MAG: FecR domain-containing protein [Polyangiaceae bacterium]